MTDLKPCPFCKGVNIELVADEICCPVEYFGHARCSDCEAIGPLAEFKYDTAEEAKAGGAEAWNTRTEPTVKPLVWEYDSRSFAGERYVSQPTGWPEYVIFWDDTALTWSGLIWGEWTDYGDDGGMDAAKAAAQADFDRRVKECLV